MANRDVHIPVGIVSPWIVLLILALSQNTIPSIFYRHSLILIVVLVSICSFVGERTPETLEPPDNPRHRGIVHKLGVLASIYIILFFATAPMLPFTQISYENLEGLAILMYLSGYASHFILDYVLAG